MKKALITGITGQDGSYLAELLLNQGYEVHGLVRRSSLENSKKLENIAHIISSIELHTTALEDHLSVYKTVAKVNPDECYHLAASSFVSYELADEMSLISTNFHSTHYLLSSILELCPNCRLYFAGSSEMFGNTNRSPQDESTPFNPRSVYGIAKLASHHLVKNYREHHGLFACTGLTYNHESPRRGLEFLPRKVAVGVAGIVLGQEKKIRLGNLTAIRDWGFAPEYMKAAWMMLNNQLGPRDYVIATGVGRTVQDLVRTAFASVDLNWEDYVESEADFFRPGEAVALIGDASAIRKDLGWSPAKPFDQMISEMVQSELKRAN